MSEPLSFCERLRAGRQRNETRAATTPVATEASDNLLPFPRRLDTGSEDEPNGAVPWLDGLRAEPWVPVVED
jgi:hypothetical protein